MIFQHSNRAYSLFNMIIKRSLKETFSQENNFNSNIIKIFNDPIKFNIDYFNASIEFSNKNNISFSIFRSLSNNSIVFKNKQKHFSTLENSKKINNHNKNTKNKIKNNEPENISKNEELNKLLMENEEKFSNLILKLSTDDEIKDFLIYLRALEICRFTIENSFTIKSRIMLLKLFRSNDYFILNDPNLDEENFIKIFGNLFYLNLEEHDILAIENKYFRIEDKLKIKELIRIFDALYYYDYYGYKFIKLKIAIIELLSKNYLVMTNDDIYELNSNLIFSNSIDISRFSLFATEKLLQYTSFQYMPHLLNLSQRLSYIQPLPKIIYEIQKSNSVSEKMKLKVLSNCTEILKKFFKNIPKEEINESLLMTLSNCMIYSNISSEIIELFINGFFRNIANFEMENLIEIFFFVLYSSKNDKNFSENKEKLMNQLLIIFSTAKLKPINFLNTHKYYIYLNNTKSNLSHSFDEWVNFRELQINKMSEIEYDLYSRFKKIIKLSIDIYPFATKDLDYSKELLEELFLTFKKIIKKF